MAEPSEEVMEDFSNNREMRQARVDVLFKDYEVRQKSGLGPIYPKRLRQCSVHAMMTLSVNIPLGFIHSERE